MTHLIDEAVGFDAAVGCCQCRMVDAAVDVHAGIVTDAAACGKSTDRYSKIQLWQQKQVLEGVLPAWHSLRLCSS